MRIVVVSEVSAADKNEAIIRSLEHRGHVVINAGMKESAAGPELTYIHTGLMAALLLEFQAADLVVGGCGTELGFMLSANQYPGVSCGLVTGPVEAWLFAQINGGNCISLPLLYGFGWAGDVNLSFIFDRYFSVESGAGYPQHRRESQQKSRSTLQEINLKVRRPWEEIVTVLGEDVIAPALTYPGFMALLEKGDPQKRPLLALLQHRIAEERKNSES